MTQTRLLHAIARAGAAPEEPGVEGLEAAGLQALCGPVPKGAPDEEWLAAAVQRHDAVVRAAFAQGPVLPIRFGTVMEPGAIADLLERHRARLSETLDRFEGLVEWGVKLFCEAGALARSVERSSEAVRALDAEIAASAPGRAYLLRRRREAAFAEALSSAREALVAECRERLMREATDEAELAVPAAMEAKEAEMIANLAFLVPSQQADGFEAAAGKLGRERQDVGLIVELSGPWPPYSFVELDLSEEGSLEPAG